MRIQFNCCGIMSLLYSTNIIFDLDVDGDCENNNRQQYEISDILGDLLKVIDEGVNRCLETETEEGRVSFVFVIDVGL
jgi:hypothetical protein